MAFLKQVPIPLQKPKRNSIPRLRHDSSKGEKLFHFQTFRTKLHIYLFNSNRELIKKFDILNDDDKDCTKTMREIRQYALNLFLSFEGNQRSAGGYTFD
jgi:hypothetical protein